MCTYFYISCTYTHTHTKQKRHNATRTFPLRQYHRASEVLKFLCFYRAPKSRQDPIKARTAACDEEPWVLMLKLYVFTAQDTGMYRSPVLLMHLRCNHSQYFTLYRFQRAWYKIVSSHLILYVHCKTRTLFMNPFLTTVHCKTAFLFYFYSALFFKGTRLDLVLNGNIVK